MSNMWPVGTMVKLNPMGMIYYRQWSWAHYFHGIHTVKPRHTDLAVVVIMDGKEEWMSPTKKHWQEAYPDEEIFEDRQWNLPVVVKS